MNAHFSTFIELGRRIASERGVNWDVRLQADGCTVPEDAWNLTKFVCGSPPPVHWIRDFGLEAKAIQLLNQRRSQESQPAIEKQAMSKAWVDLLKAVVVEQLFVRKNSTGHVVGNISRPIRILATVATSRDPWELRADDVVLAVELAKEIQPSGVLARMIISIIKTTFDANLIADIGPISPALSFEKTRRDRCSRFTKSSDELRADLEDRKHAEKLPERRAFWELIRIVFTERPKSVLDLLRFAQVKVMLLCGLRVGEACLLPVDWKRTREYYDPSGKAAGDLGGYSKAMLLRHFAEKQRSPNSDSVALFETTQYVPAMFESILAESLDEVARVTQPLRDTLRLQVKEKRILPWFKKDQLVPAIELYPYLTGNPVLLRLSEQEIDQWRTRYRAQFDSRVFDEMVDQQLRLIRSSVSTELNIAMYVYFNRLIGKLTFRWRDGSRYKGFRKQWNEVFLRIDEVEDYLAGMPTKLSDQTPHELASTWEFNAWELMFLMPKRALAEGRGTGLCDLTRHYSVGRFSPDMMQSSLSNTKRINATLFESYGRTEEDRGLTLTPHALRHLQNTELFRLGVADTIITKRFNRRSVAQSYEYDHRSLAEELEQIELPVEIEMALGSKASTVARMIKAGKASGPIVDAFNKIQQTQGEDAAFEFLKVEADGFHSTPYGHCINSFTVDPCPKHLECFSGCRHLTATDMPENRRNLMQLEKRFETAVEAIQARSAKSVGRDNQLAHAQSRLDAVRKILVAPAGMPVFPDGEDLSRSDTKPRSVLDGRK